MTNLRADEVLAESRQAIAVLTKLAARLEVFTDQIEQALARRDEDEGDDQRRPD